MDFLTSIPYWGIILIVTLNAIWVVRKEVTVMEEPDHPE